MRALVMTRHGPPSVLALQDRPSPEPAPNEVRIRVKYAGLNFADVQARLGLYPDAPKPPTVVGYEVSGTVDALGGAVSGRTLGERVLAMTRFGGQAELVCADAARVLPLPAAVSFEVAAALPVTYLTAHHLLHHAGRVKSGDKVLIHQAAGGVGTAAVQLGHLAGLTMFGTASAAKHDRLRALGLQHPIDYHSEDVGQAVEAIAGKRALRLVVDPIGPASWRQGYDLLMPGGQLLVFGFSALVGGERRNPFRLLGQVLKIPRYSPLKLMGDNRSVGGVNMGAPEFWERPELAGPQIESVLRLTAEGVLHPLVDRIFPAAEAAEAHRHLQERKNFGKVLLQFG